RDPDPALDAAGNPAIVDDDDRRHLVHAEALRELRLLIDVDRPAPERLVVLPGLQHLIHEPLDTPARARPARREVHQGGPPRVRLTRERHAFALPDRPGSKRPRGMFARPATGKPSGKNRDEMKGTVKETAGKATGDERLETEGRTDQVKGKAKEAADDAKGAVEGVRD